MNDGLIVLVYVGGAVAGSIEGWAIAEAWRRARQHFAQAREHGQRAIRTAGR